MSKKVKYIFITGGVTSSLGKGIIASSLGKLLQSRGYRVTIQKFDPYINVDPGTMNPYEHGECYVTEDGAETDLDLGHYERFLNQPTSKLNNITTGKIYQTVIERERKGDFLGKTVQVIPHITDEIKQNIYRLNKNGDYDIIITEIGGCVGDIESLPFVEAVRQARWDLGHQNSVVLHLTLVPYLQSSGELKTKPTQHSVKQLLEYGIQPDILVCRTEKPLPDGIRKKISSFCNVAYNSVIQAIDADTIYEVPLLIRKENLDNIVLDKLGLKNDISPQLDVWRSFLNKLKYPNNEIKIALIGKYTQLKDSYKSIIEALIHGGSYCECKVNIEWISSEHMIKDDKPSAEHSIEHRSIEQLLQSVHGILVAPGFGTRGIEGKIKAVQYARKNKMPFFGICLGLQVALVEFAMHVLKIKDASSREFEEIKSKNYIIDLMESQKKISEKGGTMRLGAYTCDIKKDTLAHRIYQDDQISERHRHRYEFNNHYLKAFEDAGMLASGTNPDTALVEIMELSKHPFFIGTQFHPELRSTVESPHPLFVSFIQACIQNKSK